MLQRCVPTDGGGEKIGEVRLSKEQLETFKVVIETLIQTHSKDFEKRFIAESPEKVKHFYEYYAASQGLSPFPLVRCNAPWVSTVIEADGTVRPCFFHKKIGNIYDMQIIEILNSDESISFRKQLI
jgi:MoaA/NifB/PqqE/SkfB family radical SAM enzyme